MAVKPCEQCGRGMLADTSTICGYCGKPPFPSKNYGPNHDADLYRDGWRQDPSGRWYPPKRTK
jgi:hypothetical protein